MDIPIGSGHKKAADAIIDFLELYDEIDVYRLSVFEFIPDFLAKFFLQMYLLSLKISPTIYKILYGWGNSDKKSTFWRDKLNCWLAKRACKRIVEINPDAVIATHATAGGIASVLKKQGIINAKIYGVVTDYVMHKWWYYDNMNSYFTADIAIDKTSMGTTTKVAQYGIPIRKSFYTCQSNNKDLIKKNLNIKTDLPLCLIVGGGEGLLPMIDFANSIGDGLCGYALLNITGRNISLLEKMNMLGCKEVFNYGYVENIQDYMHVSDVIISKAGGISSTEILATSKPYIIYRPLPGQESKNADYLHKQYGVYVVSNINELKNCLLNINNTKNGFVYEKAKAAELIVEDIWAEIKKS